MAGKVEVIVDELIADPEYLEENDEIPELKELLITSWGLDPAVYSILIAHGFTLSYLKMLDSTALNDVFSVAKWTGHKHALRQKLVKCEESAMFVATVCEPSSKPEEGTVAGQSDAGTSTVVGSLKHKLLPMTVTRKVLDGILERNEKGEIVAGHYQQNKRLDPTHRKYLAHTIVDYYIANQLFFTLADMARFAQLITERFPSELSETYYIPRDIKINKTHPSGMLYDRFHNRNKKTASKASKSSEISFLEQQKTAAVEISPSDIERLAPIKTWLRNNCAPPEQVIQHWRETILLRLKSIIQETDLNKLTVLAEWPRISDENGYLLIDADFEYLYKNCNANIFFDRWEKFSIDFRGHTANSTLKDDYSRRLLGMLDERNLQQDARDYILCTVFHAIVKPVRSSSKKLPTILQAQLETCYVCSTQLEYTEQVRKLREELDASKVQFEPRIFAVGNPDRFESFYVVTSSFEYRLPSFLRCFDVVVKLKFVFDFEFPESCELFWAFVVRYFYEIDYKRKSKNAQILQLVAYLEGCAK